MGNFCPADSPHEDRHSHIVRCCHHCGSMLALVVRVNCRHTSCLLRDLHHKFPCSSAPMLRVVRRKRFDASPRVWPPLYLFALDDGCGFRLRGN